MNKKLLLVSLLAVGMLVGCGGGKEDKKSDTSTSSDTSVETGKYGKAGYYIIGTGNEWSEIFWTRTNFEIFYLAPVGDGTYSLTGSISADDVKDGAKWEYKVRYFDGEGTVKDWYPDGVDNNGVITEAGEYKFVFNPDSTEKATKEDGSEYTLYTKAQRIGDAKDSNHLLISTETRSDIDQVKKDAKLRVQVTGLKVEEGQHVYAYAWDGNFFDGWKELTKSATSEDIYEVSLTNVLVGLGPLERTYELNLVISDKNVVDGEPEDGIWDGKVANPDATSGNWSITYSANKTSASLSVDLLELHSTMTTDDFITYVDTLTDYDYKVAPQYGFVTGVVTKVDYQANFNSYNITLEDTTDGKDVTIYSGALREGEDAPKVGGTISAYGIIQIFKGTTYRVAYDSTNKVSPIIYNVVNLDPQYWIRGSFDTNWDTLDDYKFKLGEEGHYTLTVRLEANTEFKVATADWGDEWNFDTVTFADDTVKACFDGKGDEVGKRNLLVVTAGTYTFSIDISGENHICTISK